MKYLKLNLLISVFPIFGFTQSPLNMECDFENGMMGWKGDGKIVEEILGNKVCSLKKKRHQISPDHPRLYTP